MINDIDKKILNIIQQDARISNAEIARNLTLGEGTVKTHVGHVFLKLGLRDRAAAVVFAFDHGVVTPGRGRPS